ncbi:MarR family transcriptional regulator [candidate division KSB1 bacterium]|nr:MarR family transcriptional regulator [candidate division KSB1 bacterium]
MSTAAKLNTIIMQLFNQCHEKELRQVERFQISMSEYRGLCFLYEFPHLSVNQLAEKMQLTNSRITRIIDGLTSRGWVQRETGLTDRRINHLFLTSEGKKLAQALFQHRLESHRQILAHIPATDHESMLLYLEKLNAAMKLWLSEAPSKGPSF